MQYLGVGCRFLIGVVFLVAVFGKIGGRSAFPVFVRSVRSLTALPPARVRPVAAAIVGAEILVVVLLCLPPRAAAVGFALAAGLLAAVAATIALGLRRGIAGRCPCFGRTVATLGWQHVVRNVVLAVTALLGQLASLACGPVNAASAAVAAVAGLLTGALLTAFDDLAHLYRLPRAADPAGE